LASHLVNDPVAGPAFARTAAAHLAPGGIVVGETYPPGWDPAGVVGTVSRLGDAEIVLLSATRDRDLLRAVVRYGIDGRTWEQPFEARVLDETALRAILAEAGLRFDGWLDRPGWFTAGAISGPA
ncbi:MAG TPA: hypothetical protein VFY23_09235, partial [Candidatus Limnocylindrales bacterium]|nr:hypothetical protein [Candidatus Limnocylindrales bacterium]